mgnify:CR=1 FL=1
MSLWTHDKIPKAIGAEHIQFHDLRYAFAALSLKNRGGRKTVIWGCRATIRMDPPFAPTPIPHPKRSRALGAPSASRYGKNRRPSICQVCSLSVQICRSRFFQNRFQRRTSTRSTPYRRNSSSASGPIRSPDTAMGIAGGHPTVGAPQTRPSDRAAGTVSRGANSASRTEHTRSPRASGSDGCGV